MPINVIGNSSFSHDNGNKTDTSISVQKPCLRTNYLESNIEGDIDMKKKQYKIKKLPGSQEKSDAVRKCYEDSGLNDPNIIRSTAHAAFNDENLDNVRFVKVDSLPGVREHLTPNFYADEAISHSVDEPILVRNNQDNEFNNHN